jgi:carboxyl-terminal processing protease
MHRRLLFGLSALLPLVVSLTIAGCQDDSSRSSSNQLNRDVPAVTAVLSQYYLYRQNIPPNAQSFATVEDLLAALNDPFTFEVTQQSVVSFDQGQQTGIKGFGVAHLDSIRYVNTIDPGGPAWREGLRRNDIVRTLGSLAVVASTTDAEVSTALSDDPLTIQVERAGQPLTFTIPNESFATVTVEEQSIDQDTHYVRIGSFNLTSVDPRGPTGELETILLQNPSKSRWVIDMRWNGGGSLTRACEISDLFLVQGLIVALTDVNGGSAFDCSALGGQGGESKAVVVLVNGSSASASELVLAALQDLRGVQAVGETTLGKGVAQTLFDYVGGGRLVMVTHQLESATGRAWQGVGIPADVPAVLDPVQLVAGVDSQLQAALTTLATVSPRTVPSPFAPASPIIPLGVRDLVAGLPATEEQRH